MRYFISVDEETDLLFIYHALQFSIKAWCETSNE